MNEQSQKDVDDALEATKNIICIMLAARVKSPYEDYSYETNPCVKKWLVENRGWT